MFSDFGKLHWLEIVWKALPEHVPATIGIIGTIGVIGFGKVPGILLAMSFETEPARWILPPYFGNPIRAWVTALKEGPVG